MGGYVQLQAYLAEKLLGRPHGLIAYAFATPCSCIRHIHGTDKSTYWPKAASDHACELRS